MYKYFIDSMTKQAQLLEETLKVYDNSILNAIGLLFIRKMQIWMQCGWKLRKDWYCFCKLKLKLQAKEFQQMGNAGNLEIWIRVEKIEPKPF